MSWLNSIHRSRLRVRLSDLPIGAYLVTNNGDFLDANSEARDLLELPHPPDLQRKNIANLYANPIQRVSLAHRLINEGSISDEIIEFIIGNQRKYFQVNCRLLPSKGNEHFLGTIVDITADYQYHKLFDHLPSGVYQIDSQDRIIRANRAFAVLHGYDTADELKGLSVKTLYADPAELEGVRQLLDQQDVIEDHTVHLKKRSGEIFLGTITAIKRLTAEGDYDGREGTVRDTTRIRRYERVLSTVPVGLYTADTTSYGDKIQHCNEYFARLHGYGDPQELIGMDLRTFHSDDLETKSFLEELDVAAKTKQEVHRNLHITTKSGDEKTIRVSCLPLATPDGTLLGRTGAVQDVTEELELRTHIHRLTEDVGHFLHMYTTLLMGLNQRLTRWEDLLTDVQLPDQYLPDEPTLLEAALPYENSFIGDLSHFIGEYEQLDLRPSQECQLSRLRVLAESFQRERDRIAMAHRMVTARATALEVNEILTSLKPIILPKASWRSVESSATRLAHFYTFVDMREVHQNIVGVDASTNTLRAYIIEGEAKPEPLAPVSLSKVLSRATITLAEYARTRGITMIPDDRTSGALLLAQPDALHRAICNIIHNAIKYTWASRQSNAKVEINAFVKGNSLIVKVVNIGVGIPEDEWQKGIIFEFGQRGRWSNDQSRPGTGVGLADSYQIVHRYGGNLTIESRPLDRDFNEIPSGNGSDSNEKSLRTTPHRTECVVVLPKEVRAWH